MKFKVYVCTDKEEHEGLCDPCTTEGCYYKGKEDSYKALFSNYSDFPLFKVYLSLNPFSPLTFPKIDSLSAVFTI